MVAKKSSRRRSRASTESSLQEQAEQLQRKLGESAQQVWLAGLGTFSRAQTQGARLFNTMARQGSRVEQRANNPVHEARERAAAAFGRVDQAFRGRVQGALKALENPIRRELGTLLDRVESLNGQLRRYNGRAETAPTKARKSAARKAAAGTPAGADGAPTPQATVKKSRPRAAAKKVAGHAPDTAPAKKAAARRTTP